MSKPHNIFISWSGDRSRFIAEALADWLPRVLQSARPWLSTRSIDKGTHGLSEMSKALGVMGFGVSCLTPDNLTAPWILFEAGSLSKAFDEDKARLWTYLLGGLEPKDVEPPLGQFQHTKAEKEDTRKLVQSVNIAINREEDRLEKEIVDDTFNRWWPELESAIGGMPQAEKVTTARRKPDEIMTEILELCRQYLPRLGADSDPKRMIPLSALAQSNFADFLAAARDPLAGLSFSPTPDSNKTFHVKVANDNKVKEIVGTSAVEPFAGSLIVLNADGAVVARFSEGVEMFW